MPLNFSSVIRISFHRNLLSTVEITTSVLPLEGERKAHQRA
jgi:hypothetical protein